MKKLVFQKPFKMIDVVEVVKPVDEIEEYDDFTEEGEEEMTLKKKEKKRIPVGKILGIGAAVGAAVIGVAARGGKKNKNYIPAGSSNDPDPVVSPYEEVNDNSGDDQSSDDEN